MKYKFTGKPDKKFPDLLTGAIYELGVQGGVPVGSDKPVLIVTPFYCPYTSWETFYANWEPVEPNVREYAKGRILEASREKTVFEYEYVPTQEEVRKHIQDCEGKHTQQAIYSTFHDALTQVCFGCKKIRSSLRR